MTRPGRPPEALAAAPRIPGRFRRALAMAAATGGLSVVFVTALVGGVLLHLDAAPTRRIAREVLNTQLVKVFHGRLIADEIERVSLSGVRIRGATVLDPHGHQVVRVNNIRARADVPKIVYDALLGTGPLLVELPWIRLENADVVMEMGDDGVPTIADAFTPIESPPEPEPTLPSAPSRDVRVHMTHIEIGHAWAHGPIADPRSLDADVNKLVAAVRIEPYGVLVDTEPVSIVDRALLPAKTQGTGEYHLRVDFNPGGEDNIRMWMGFTGQLDEVELTARGTIEDGFLSAQADIAQALPDQVKAIIPSLPLREPTTASIVMEGQIPAFDVTAQVRTHDLAKYQASATAVGGFDATGPLSMRLAVTAEHFDPRVLDEGYPNVRVDAAGTVTVLLAEGQPRVIVDASTEAAELEGVKVPATDVHAVLDRGVLSGNTHLYEPGMPVDATFLVDEGGALRFKARSRIPSIAAVPRLGGGLDGSADVRVFGSIVDGQLDAAVDGTVSNIKAGGDVSLAQGTVRGTVRGRVTEPGALDIAASLNGSQARTGGYEFAEITASARGPARAPRLSATLTDGQTGFVSADGVLDPRAAVVRDVNVEVERDGNKVSGKIARVGAAQGGIAVEGVALTGEGMGSLQGGLLVRGDDVSGKLAGQGVDLARVARLVGIPYKVKGLANIDIDVERSKTGRTGHVLLELVDGETPLVSGISMQLAAKLDGDQVTVDALARLVAEPETQPGETPAPQLPNELPRCAGTIAQVRITKGEGTLHGPLLSAKTWLATRGRVEVAAEDWNLHCLARLFPVGLPVSEVRGTATTRFVIERGEADRFPSVPSLAFRTHQLSVLGPQGVHDNEPEWESTAMDVKLEGSLDGKSGETKLKLSLYDGYLPPELAATVTLDLPTLVDDPGKRRASLLASPLTARLTMPRRAIAELKTLPTPVHPYLPPLAGDVRIDGYVDGTVAEPFITVRAIGWNLAYAERGTPIAASAWSLPVDVDLLATYDTHQGTLDAHVTKGGREIVSANAQIEADLEALVEAKPDQKSPWTGGFYAKLEEVPLGELPRLADNGIGGHVNGTISMTGMNQEPTLKVALTLPDLKIGDDLYFEEGVVNLDIAKGPDGKQRGIATARLIGHDGGRLDSTAYAGVVWKDGLIPTIDNEAPADLHARAEKFRLAALHPFVSDVLSKLDGQLDGDIRVGWKRVGAEDQGSIVARMDVVNGVFHVPQIGQEFRNTTVKIRTADQPTQGEGLIRFDDIQAEGISGRVRGWAIARVDGLKFLDAGGELTVAEGAGNELPVTLEGVPLGTAWGNVTLKAEKTDNTIAVSVGVPQLHISLPSAPSKNVQTLDENPDIEVSHPLGPEKELRSADALRWVVSFDLGRIVVEGTGVEVRLRGVVNQPPRVELTDKARVTGDIEIVEGIVAAYGKEFRIERGLVRMRAEDTSNPYLNVTAYWDSPDGARIYVDYVGILKPVTDEKLRFRSNPPRSEQDILATLLFGADFEQDPGGRSRGADASRATGNLAAGVGGGVAAEQLNQMLAGTALHNFSTRIGTNEEGNVKTSLVFEVSESVTSTYSYEDTSATGAQGGPAGGASGQRAGRYQVSIDWRFHRNWLVRGSVGYEAGQPSSGVDLLWQYRY